MELRLDPSDLAKDFQKPGRDGGVDSKDPISTITFSKLNRPAQAAVCAVGGRALIYAWDGRTYNAVMAPGRG